MKRMNLLFAGVVDFGLETEARTLKVEIGNGMAQTARARFPERVALPLSSCQKQKVFRWLRKLFLMAVVLLSLLSLIPTLSIAAVEPTATAIIAQVQSELESQGLGTITFDNYHQWVNFVESAATRASSLYENGRRARTIIYQWKAAKEDEFDYAGKRAKQVTETLYQEEDKNKRVQDMNNYIFTHKPEYGRTPQNLEHCDELQGEWDKYRRNLDERGQYTKYAEERQIILAAFSEAVSYGAKARDECRRLFFLAHGSKKGGGQPDRTEQTAETSSTAVADYISSIRRQFNGRIPSLTTDQDCESYDRDWRSLINEFQQTNHYAEWLRMESRNRGSSATWEEVRPQVNAIGHKLAQLAESNVKHCYASAQPQHDQGEREANEQGQRPQDQLSGSSGDPFAAEESDGQEGPDKLKNKCPNNSEFRDLACEQEDVQSQFRQPGDGVGTEFVDFDDKPQGSDQTDNFDPDLGDIDAEMAEIEFGADGNTVLFGKRGSNAESSDLLDEMNAARKRYRSSADAAESKSTDATTESLRKVNQYADQASREIAAAQAAKLEAELEAARREAEAKLAELERAAAARSINVTPYGPSVIEDILPNIRTGNTVPHFDDDEEPLRKRSSRGRGGCCAR
ncbi:MAG: hypothetical protein ACSLFH_14400 [Desulfuromonadales bacterium]